MHLIFLALCLIGFLTPVVGQTTTMTEPVPSIENDYFPERWKEYCVEGRFRVLFPDTPKESTNAVPTAAGEVLIHNVSYKSFASYTVTSTQYPSEIEKQSKTKGFMDQLRDSSLAAVAKGKPEVVSESDFTLDGHPGRALQVEFANDSVVRFRWIAVKDRVYILHVTTPKSRKNVMGAENDYEKVAKTFLDSFRLLK